mgnify:CR=1 FL=1
MKAVSKSTLTIVSKKVKVRITRLNEELIEAGFSKGEVVLAARDYIKKKATRRITFESKGGEFDCEAYLGIDCELASHY